MRHGQQLGHLRINGETILVLARDKRLRRSLKLRNYGKEGIYFEDESIHIENTPFLINLLKLGETITV